MNTADWPDYWEFFYMTIGLTQQESGKTARRKRMAYDSHLSANSSGTMLEPLALLVLPPLQQT